MKQLIKNKYIISAILLLALSAFIIIPPSSSVRAGILDLWQSKTEYTVKDNEKDKEEVTLTYIFNNEIHTNYSSGTAYEIGASTVQTYEKGTNVDVKNIDEVFPGYIGTTGACEFIEWNTQPDGSGDSYAPNSVFLPDNTVVLYAIWKSCRPNVDNIYEYDAVISGTGVVQSTALIGSIIEVILPDGVIVQRIVEPDGRWRIVVPASSSYSMSYGEEITVYQKEKLKRVSDPVTIIIQ